MSTDVIIKISVVTKLRSEIVLDKHIQISQCGFRKYKHSGKASQPIKLVDQN